MKTTYLLMLFFVLALGTQAQTVGGKPQTPSLNDPWRDKDLIQPSELAAILNNPKAKQPLVLNIGVVDDIKGATNVGAASKKENLDQFKSILNRTPKSSQVIIYCGCCPFYKCPNIRPAFTALKEMGFKNGKLLNIPVNLKQDWIGKGYPMAAADSKK